MSGLFTSLTLAKIQSPIKGRKQKCYILKHLLHIIIEQEATQSDICVLRREKYKVVRRGDLMVENRN